MKKSYIQTFFLSLAFMAITMACSKGEDNDTPDTPEPTPEVTEAAFAKGADVSWVTQMEKEGLTFYTPGKDRKKMECMQLLRDYCGVNSIRLRVWVNPADGWNNVNDVLVKAMRAQKLGMRLMIDFHFSDTWADPSNQKMPKAWEGKSYEEVKVLLADHVTQTLTTLKNSGCNVEWVQIGNETTPGMLLPMGNIATNPAQYSGLNNAGYDAVKAVYSKAKVIVHLDSGNDQWRFNRMFDALKKFGGKYDMIGMSVYPYWAEQQGEKGGWKKVVSDALTNISNLKKRYSKPVMICEVGMPYNQAETCKEFISELTKAPVEGIFYWEPEAPHGYNDGYDLGCFDNGAPTVALDAFK